MADDSLTVKFGADTSGLVSAIDKAQTVSVWLDALSNRMNSFYSRLKELTGMKLSDADQVNVAQEHMREAQGHLTSLQTASLLRDVSPEEVKAAWQRIFDAGNEVAKANPIPALAGGDPREKRRAERIGRRRRSRCFQRGGQ